MLVPIAHRAVRAAHSAGDRSSSAKRLNDVIYASHVAYCKKLTRREQAQFVRKLRTASVNHSAMNEDMIRERGKRLREAAQLRGYGSPKDVIDAHAKDGVKSSYYQHSKGNAAYSFKYAELYGRIFNVRPEWLYSGTGSMTPLTGKLAVIGDVAAGEAHFDDAYLMGGAMDWLEPPETEGRIALRVKGDSMAPLAHDGDYAVFGPRRDDVQSLLGQRVMARLDDDRKLFKVLRRGARPGLYTLYSLNSAYDPIENVSLMWALPLEWIKTQ